MSLSHLQREWSLFYRVCHVSTVAQKGEKHTFALVLKHRKERVRQGGFNLFKIENIHWTSV